MFNFGKLAFQTARPLPNELVMNWIDFIIIYLACGAPFGVYYFMLHRTTTAGAKMLWIKTFLNFLFWMPFALLILRQSNFFNFGKLPQEDFAQEKNFRLIVKHIEKIFLTSRLEYSVYEFREILERYIGLTIANQTDAARIADADKEFFRIAEPKNIELGAICLNRRNRKRLARHQTEARKDFLTLIAQISKTKLDEINLKHRSIELADYLKDREAQEKLESLFADETQTADCLNVVDTEKILWKPAAVPKPPTAEQISYQLPIMNATLNLRRKD